MVHSHLRFVTRELLHELKLQKRVQNPFLNFSFHAIVHAIVHAIAGVNAPTLHITTHHLFTPKKS